MKLTIPMTSEDSRILHRLLFITWMLQNRYQFKYWCVLPKVVEDNVACMYTRFYFELYNTISVGPITDYKALA